ncbi:MAG: hypothetical protein A2W22_04595 [Candidatus Levybacteria bacterium RBG_16_35_11]|nr:MAG: hypothetical protein A2W22_04595 [Candidatus Levybacteria bacterium RBG_16_35_11]
MELWTEKNATQRQIEYIKILSNYPDTKDKDAEDIRCFLSQQKKGKIEELTKTEASELIETLLVRPVKYVFLCGKEKFIDKKDYNRYYMLGKLEACLHECETDVNACPKWFEEETRVE